MLSQNMQQVLAENRRAERIPIALQLVLQRIDKQDYVNLIEWMFQVKIFQRWSSIIFLLHIQLTQNSECLGLSCSTKFLARTFFDSSILEPQVIPYDKNIALALAGLSLAIKFNESRELSEQLTLQSLLKSIDICLSRADYLSLEAKVMRSLKYIFRFTSPNDYLEIFMERFPFFPKFRKAIPKFIELALLRPSACQFTAQQLFFGTVLSVIQLRKKSLNQFQHLLLLSLTDCWQKAKSAANMVMQAILIAQSESFC